MIAILVSNGGVVLFYLCAVFVGAHDSINQSNPGPTYVGPYFGSSYASIARINQTYHKRGYTRR